MCIIRQQMKKVILIILFTFILFALYVLVQKVHKYYFPIKPMVAYQTAHNDDDTIRIAYIGDSWAYMHQHQGPCLIPQIIESQVAQPTKVFSYGLGGRTSKEIYEALFADKHLRTMMCEHGADYCFISAGINDVNKKLSIRYYQNSMDNIIRFMLKNHIRPVILEIPDYDVNKAYRVLKNSSKLLRMLSMTINAVPMDCKQIYRNALDTLIKEKGYQEKVSVVRYKLWNNDYHHDQKRLYLKDGFHLNDYGYTVLDSAIAMEILKNIEDYENRN